MMNKRKQCDVKVLITLDSFDRHRNYESRVILDDENVLLYRNKKIIKLNQPIYGGFVVLELSKLLLFDFYYNVFKKKYGNGLILLATDTDSLIVSIDTEDFYEDMKESLQHYDTFGYVIDSMPQVNKKVPGLFKDEYLGIPLREFIGLRSKMYSFRNDFKEKKVCKGIKRVNIEKMNFNMYKDTLMHSQITKETIYSIVSRT